MAWYVEQTLYTPLLEATMNRHAPIAQKLINAGANVQLANLDGDYPALLAAELGLVTVLEEIVAQAKTPYSLDVQNDVSTQTCLRMPIRY